MLKSPHDMEEEPVQMDAPAGKIPPTRMPTAITREALSFKHDFWFIGCFLFVAEMEVIVISLELGRVDMSHPLKIRFKRRKNDFHALRQ